MFCRAACFLIKDLKDLENVTTRFSIDMQDLKDLKRLGTIELARDRQPHYEKNNGFLFP